MTPLELDDTTKSVSYILSSYDISALYFLLLTFGSDRVHI